MNGPPTLSGPSRDEIQRLVVQLQGEVAELKRVATSPSNEEIARLKGLKGRPDISQAAWRGITPKTRQTWQVPEARQVCTTG